MEITKDAKSMIYLMYKEYKSRRKNGMSKIDSKTFGSARSIQGNLLPDTLLSDIEDTLRELGRNEYVDNFYASNTIYYCSLSDKAISVLENQSTETFLSVTDFISKFIP